MTKPTTDTAYTRTIYTRAKKPRRVATHPRVAERRINYGAVINEQT